MKCLRLSHRSLAVSPRCITQSSRKQSLSHRYVKIRPRAQSDDENTSGPEERSPLPPPPPIDDDDNTSSDNNNLQLPPDVVRRIKERVFNIDTFFPRETLNYDSGVLFKGNLRGDASVAQEKMNRRLQDEFSGAEYQLFLLQDQEETPVVVILPAVAAQVEISGTAEAGLAVFLLAATAATTLNTYGAELFNAALLAFKFDPDLIASAVPGSLATFAILFAHEAGHFFAAKKQRVELAPPLLLPAGLGLLGSLGVITRIKSIVPNRATLAAVTAPGPLAGAGASLIFLLLGAALTAAGSGGIQVDSSSFKESLLVGSLARLAFGEGVFSADFIDCNPYFVAGWAGMIINALNCLPVGETDGGRLALAAWGRPSASRISAISLFLLGLWGITNGMPLFWLLLVLTLQRGPIIPCSEELTEPSAALKNASLFAILLLPALVLLPLPDLNALLTGGDGDLGAF